MTANNHRTDCPDRNSDEAGRPAPSDQNDHPRSYYYDDATGYEVFRDDDEEDEDAVEKQSRSS